MERQEKAWVLLETANFHEGCVDRIEQAIGLFSDIETPHVGIGIKFHAFRPEYVVAEGTPLFERVKSFFIEASGWERLIGHARRNGLGVWLDIFCIYGLEILERNLERIKGIKLQPSILDNREILERLGKLNLRNIDLIMNVAGLQISDIEEYLVRYQTFGFGRVILQMGFQNFPTGSRDTSLEKIGILGQAFPRQILSYADHIAPEEDHNLAVNFPAYAYISGCSILEKHICLSRKDTPIDGVSALEKEEVKEIVSALDYLCRSRQIPFVCEREALYYQESLQRPVVSRALRAGQLLSEQDVVYRRVDGGGLSIRDVRAVQRGKCVLACDLRAGETVRMNHYKKAVIGVVVAARLKSQRLKGKALLPLAGIPSIERCLMSASRIRSASHVVLATSNLPDDDPLGNYDFGSLASVFRGDPDDVIDRYLGACEQYGIDVVVRATGDNPLLSEEIAEFLLTSHFSAGADFSQARRSAIGPAVQIYNVSALRMVQKLLGRAEYSEHMTYYLTNNPHIFKINTVALPDELVRDYRMTLDYPEDRDMFQALYEKLSEERLDVNLANAFSVLDRFPEIPLLNSHKMMQTAIDKALLERIMVKTTISV